MKTLRYALSGLLALVAMPAFAVNNASPDARATAVAADGAVYVATAGTYGALFPQGSAAAATTPVLALDITSADGDSSRVLVAGTDDAAAEEAPVVFTQDSTGDVYLVWSSRSGAAASLLLRAYSNGRFSDSVTLDDNAFAAKGAPQVALTRDAFTTVDAQGLSRAVQRSVLHLLWWEGGAQGGSAMYRSVLFVNGGLVGANSLIDLGNLDAPGAEATADRVSDALTHSPVLARGRNERAALMGFVNPRSGRLLTVEVGVVPGELSSLADDLADYVVGLGASGGLGDMQHVGAAVRIHISGGGSRISDRVLQALGPGVASHVVASGRSFGGDAVALANDTRRFLLREGANLLANGIDSRPPGQQHGHRSSCRPMPRGSPTSSSSGSWPTASTGDAREREPHPRLSGRHATGRVLGRNERRRLHRMARQRLVGAAVAAPRQRRRRDNLDRRVAQR